MLLKKKGVWLASVLVLNSWVGGALADESATLEVTANILPGSCRVVFTANTLTGNKLDLGTIPVRKLREADYHFPDQKVSLEVDCDADTKFYLTSSDDSMNTAGSSDESWSLKREGTDIILGSYKLAIQADSITAGIGTNSLNVVEISSGEERDLNKPLNRLTGTQNFLASKNGAGIKSIFPTNNNISVAVKKLTVPIIVKSKLKQTTLLDMSHGDVVIKGKTDVTLKYL